MSIFTFHLQGNFLASKIFPIDANSDIAALEAFNKLDFAALDAPPWCIDALTVDDVEVCDEDSGDTYPVEMEEYEEAIFNLENAEGWEQHCTGDRMNLHHLVAALQDPHLNGQQG